MKDGALTVIDEIRLQIKQRLDELDREQKGLAQRTPTVAAQSVD